MEIRVLQYFLAIAREQSIVRAAQSLHLSQPTLSTQIKNLEEELGKQLFIRGTKGSRKVTLTEEGMILRKRAEEILDLVKKAENEILLSDSVIIGDVYIGAGETDGMRLLAKMAGKLRRDYPGIHYHISSGNANFVMERLDKGLIDFGLIFMLPDLKKYDVLKLPTKNVWVVIMQKDDPLAEKESISPEDLWDKPLILSQELTESSPLIRWMRKKPSTLNTTVSYNLLFNASLFVEEGLGYAISFDKLLNISGDSGLVIRPLNPPLEVKMYLVWKKYQVFSKAADKFLQTLHESLDEKVNV
ncbi:MAG: LysR family transcriptional regulator [Eubacteriales bacterium]|nr:LysR family transcriptional regulator [Eubacteriales bacterium]